jgi:hypothetical protein
MLPYRYPSTSADRIRNMRRYAPPEYKSVADQFLTDIDMPGIDTRRPGLFLPTDPQAMPRPATMEPAPMPDATPARNFVPQDPKPMPKPRAPVRMDAPTQPTRRR